MIVCPAHLLAQRDGVLYALTLVHFHVSKGELPIAKVAAPDLVSVNLILDTGAAFTLPTEAFCHRLRHDLKKGQAGLKSVSAIIPNRNAACCLCSGFSNALT
jgi:hypothetical protein